MPFTTLSGRTWGRLRGIAALDFGAMSPLETASLERWRRLHSPALPFIAAGSRSFERARQAAGWLLVAGRLLVGRGQGRLMLLGAVIAALPACRERRQELAPSDAALGPAREELELGPGRARGPVHEIGERVQASEYAMTIQGVQECKVKHYFRPREGNLKLGVEVLIESTAATAVPVNPFYAKVIDRQGFKYTSTFAGCEPQLRSTRLEGEDEARGWITFEIPAQAAGLELDYDPYLVGRPKEVLRFDLGR